MSYKEISSIIQQDATHFLRYEGAIKLPDVIEVVFFSAIIPQKTIEKIHKLSGFDRYLHGIKEDIAFMDVEETNFVVSISPKGGRCHITICDLGNAVSNIHKLELFYRMHQTFFDELYRKYKVS